MKLLRSLALVLVALAIAVGSFAANNVRQLPDGTYVNVQTGAACDANGNALIRDGAPDRNFVLLQPTFLSTRFVYGADGVSTGWTSPKCLTVDSASVAASTAGYGQLALLVYPSFEDSVAAALFAVDVRVGENTSTDTLSVYHALRWKRFVSGKGTAGSAPDTLGSFTEIPVNQVQFGSNGLDTLQLCPGEFPMVLGPNKNTTAGIVIPLNNTDGTPITGPNISVRWRIMNTYGANFTSWTHSDGTLSGLLAFGAKGARTNVIACQSCGDTRFVILRADLIGWR